MCVGARVHGGNSVELLPLRAAKCSLDGEEECWGAEKGLEDV